MEGKITACKWVHLACERHLGDLERSKTAAFRYRFDEGKANRVCRFIEALPHTKDDFENRAARGETLKLQPWQLFIVCSLFGWVDKQMGKYRFREAYIEVPRKNGKSVLAAGIGLYKFAADDEFGAEVYSGATSEKQAWEIFRPARQMTARTAALREAFGITVNAKSLTILSNGSRFEPVIGKPGDGASPSCALIDEFHEHTSDELVETMRTGMGARRNPLLFQITTAGTDRSSPCYSRHLDVQGMLARNVENDRLFGIIYGIDEADDWKSPDAARKANPNYGFSVDAEYLEHEQQQAIQSARLQNAYLTKNLNVWRNADVAWMNMAKWDACADPSLRIEDFEQQECRIGMDLASRIDLASICRVFRRLVDGKSHFYAFWSHYLNEGRVEQSANSHYRGWARGDLLTVTPGNETDYGYIAEDLVKDSNRFIVREIPHDPYHAAALIQFIKARPDWNQEAEFVEVPQNVQNLSPAMKELEALVFSDRFHHDGDEISSWAIANVVCHRDAKDNIFPRKQREENKIDPVIALLMPILRWVTVPEEEYTSSDVFFV